jgi:hypothetical protein
VRLHQAIRSIALAGLVLAACGRSSERTEQAPAAPPPVASQSADAAAPVAVPATGSAIDLAPTRSDLKQWAEQVCACKDARCADTAGRPFFIWEKEVELQKDHPEHAAYVAAVRADAQITKSVVEIVTCSRALRK